MASESRLGLNWSEVAAGAVAALTGAATAMLLGVYGTFIGAGVMSAVTTVVATVSHHYASRTRARLHQLRQGRGAETRPAARGARRPRREMLGGSALVAGTAVATVAALGFLVPSPFGKELLGNAGDAQTRPVIVKKVVKVEGDDSSTETSGNGGTTVNGDGSPGGHESGPEVTPETEHFADGNGRSGSEGTPDRYSTEEESGSTSGPSSGPESGTSSPAPNEPSEESTAEPTSGSASSDDSGSGDGAAEGVDGSTEGQSTTR